MFKDLLVEIDDSDTSRARINYAIDLARRFDAHLTGLHIIQTLMLPPSVGTYMTGDVEAQILAGEKERANQAIDQFREIAERSGIRFETRTDQGSSQDSADLLSLHGRYADLTIIGQQNPDHAGSAIDPGDVVLAAGAPVMIVPHIGAPSTTAENVTIAWNATRESARAVRDAMPLLERAKTVEVVCFQPRSSGDGHGDQPGADIALHLSRHGIKVGVQILEGSGIDVGNALLSHLADRDSDLLVMGGYGHSRLREAVLGGATRTILQSMTVPTLMSH